MIVLWLVVGCAFPLHRVHEARRRGREQLRNVLAAGTLDKPGIIMAFERSNQDLDAAASGPCLILVLSVIYLGWQLLKLKRRYNELTLDTKYYRGRNDSSAVRTPN